MATLFGPTNSHSTSVFEAPQKEHRHPVIALLSRIEGGLTRPSYRTAVRLATVLDATLNDMAAAYRDPSDGTHQLVTRLVDAGMDRKDALAIQSRLTRPLRDALFTVLGE